MEVSNLINTLKQLGFPVETVSRTVSFRDAIRIAWEKNRTSPVYFLKVRGKSVLPIISNVFYSRDAILKVLKVESIEDAYSKLFKAASNPKPLREASIEDTHVKAKFSSLKELIPLYKFFPRDGGAYVTSSIVVAGDGEGVYNASIHRLMFLGGSKFAIRLVERHLYKLYSEFKSRGEDLPVAILIGAHPSLLLFSAYSPPYGVYEVELANSALEGRLVCDRLLNTEVPVPLNSDLIMLGRIRRDLQVREGPFVDITGTYDEVRVQPVLEVDEVWVLNGASYHIILPGGVEHRLLMGFPREAQIWDGVRRVVSEVKSVRLTVGGCGWLHAIVSIKKEREGDGKNAIIAALASHPSLKHVVVVDEDVNVDNLEEVEWAIATRFRADRDLVVVRGVRGSTLDPTAENGVTAKMGIDATAPLSGKWRFKRVTPQV